MCRWSESCETITDGCWQSKQILPGRAFCEGPGFGIDGKMIQYLELNNFTTFTSLPITFSRGINVIIGENGTGKSHLLKAGYALAAGAALLKNKPELDKEEFAEKLTRKVLRLFMPLEDKLWELRRYGASDGTRIEAHFETGQRVVATFNTNSKQLSIGNSPKFETFQDEPVYMPTKEVLALMRGFVSLYEKYGLSFDQSYYDVCLLLDLPALRSEALHEKSKWAIEEITAICGGRFVFYGGGNVTFKTKDKEYSANSAPEGFRKLGMLARLLETGSIHPGVSGPLFWDEPESNMNPKLMKLLVQIMLELSRNGQQIILATHDYVLLKWFDLLINKDKDDQVRFHALSRDAASGGIKVESVDSYRSLTVNAIAATFTDLYDAEIDRSFAGQNR